jgi:hypothetical protein
MRVISDSRRLPIPEGRQGNDEGGRKREEHHPMPPNDLSSAASPQGAVRCKPMFGLTTSACIRAEEKLIPE